MLQTKFLVATAEYVKTNPIRAKEAEKKGLQFLLPQYFYDSVNGGQLLELSSYLIPMVSLVSFCTAVVFCLLSCS